MKPPTKKKQKRWQFSVTAESHRRIRIVARRRGISMADLVDSLTTDEQLARFADEMQAGN